jgi:2-dehydro-3-deoxygluconokinase
MNGAARQRAPELVAIGEAMWAFASSDSAGLSRATHYVASAAGAESNVAIGAASLGVSSAWIGKLGDDPFGHAILGQLQDAGVDCSAVSIEESLPTGLMFKGPARDDDTEVVYRRAESAGAALTASDLDRTLLADARVIHVSGITAALSKSCAQVTSTALVLARDGGALASFDLNVRPQLWQRDPAEALRELTALADVCFASAQEAMLLTGRDDPFEAAGEIADLGPSTVVVKLGAEGALALEDGEIIQIPPRVVDAVDAVGAGDAFAAGFLVSRLKHADLRESLAIAAWCGAEVARSRRDAVALPDWADLRERVNAFDPPVGAE